MIWGILHLGYLCDMAGHYQEMHEIEAALLRSMFGLVPTQIVVKALEFTDMAQARRLNLSKWWTRYICPPGGVVCDPFMGSGTMGLAALAYGCQFIGIEKEDRPGYFPTAETRIAAAQLQPALFAHSASEPAPPGLWDDVRD